MPGFDSFAYPFPTSGAVYAGYEMPVFMSTQTPFPLEEVVVLDGVVVVEGAVVVAEVGAGVDPEVGAGTVDTPEVVVACVVEVVVAPIAGIVGVARVVVACVVAGKMGSNGDGTVADSPVAGVDCWVSFLNASNVARVCGPTTPKPVVKGSPEETMPRFAWNF